MGVEYKDYYKILGVTRQASDKEIRSAYRKLAREYHPDVNAGSDEKFKELNEAYEALKDPERRRMYDSLGSNWRQGQNFDPGGFGGFGGGGGYGPDMGSAGMGDFSSFFDILFGSQGGMNFGGGGFGGGGFGGASGFDPGAYAGGGGRHQRQTRQKPDPLEQDLSIELELVARGGHMDIQTPNGKRLSVNIPKGIKEGTKIRVSGEGGNGRDIHLIARYRPHLKFHIEQEKLVYEAPLPVPDFVLGGEIRVPAFNGEITVSVPAGSQPGRLMRLKGQGLPDKEGRVGDLFVRPRAVIPSHPTDRELELYRELRALQPQN